MPSTTTYLDVVNKVLRACGAPSASSVEFLSPAGTRNARELRIAKEIVAELYTAVQNKRPDSWWRRAAEIRIYKPFVEGGVIQINSGSPTQVDFAFDGALDFDDVPWFPAGVAQPTPGTFLHIQGERQYYRVSLKQSATRLGLVSANIEHVGYNDPTRPIGYAIFRRTYDLPADFRDVLNVTNEYAGSDLRPLGPEHSQEAMISTGSLGLTAGGGGFGSDPEAYAIVREDAAASAPKLLIHPVPTEDRLLTVHYLAHRSVLAQPADTFDMDEDAMPEFWTRCQAEGALQISRNVEEAREYERKAAMARDDLNQKSMERGDFQRMTPSTGTDYRDHYSASGLRASRRTINLKR